MCIFLVEDEVLLWEILVVWFKCEGFVVDVVQDGEEGLYMGCEVLFDVGIIDLGLFKMLGMELIKVLCDEGKKFFVFILIVCLSWQDKVEGFKQGVDDYLVKLFYVEELLVCVNVLLCCVVGWSKFMFECGLVVFDLVVQMVSVGGSNVDFISYEYKVFEYLMMYVGELVFKVDFIEYIYQQDFDCDLNVLEVFIGCLCKKFDVDGEFKLIEIVCGCGYCFVILCNEG